MRPLFYMVSALLLTTNFVHAQHTALGDAAASDPGNAASSAAQESIARRQAALQFTQQIQSINNEFGNQIGALQTQMAQQNVQKNQCEIDYAQAIGDAEAQAQEQKSSAMQNMLGQAMGPALQALGGILNKEDQKQVENFSAQVNDFNNEIDNTFNEFGMGVSGRHLHQDPKGAINRASFGSAINCNLHMPDQNKVNSCMMRMSNLEQKKQALNNLAAEHNIDQNASSDIGSKLLQAAIPIGMGMFASGMTKKGAEQSLQATKEAAEYARTQCLANADIAISESKRQLANLEKQKKESIKTAQEAAGIANEALNAEIAQRKLEATYGDGPGLPVDPNTIPNSDEGINPALLSAATIGDPQALGSGSNKQPLGFAQNSGSDDKAQVGGGGAGGGGGGAGGGGTPWTYGSSYPGFPGGGGLPDQGEKGKFSGIGGTSGIGGVGGFASAQDAFNSFAQWGGRDAGEGRALASNGGDGGLLLLLQRARLRLSSHAAELLTNNHMELLTRKDSTDKTQTASPQPAVQRATASRLR